VNERTDYIEGLRQLADLLDANPDVPLPYTGAGTFAPLQWVEVDDDARAVFAKVASIIPGTKTKRTDEYNFALAGQLAGLHVAVLAPRYAVCARVVIGTREVTEEVPDPEAPKVTVTRTEEIVEWKCAPLLADATGGAS
jgi:hypothetical protein